MNPEPEHSIVNLVERILAKAIDDRAAYLYFEPQAHSLQIRIRQDRLLQTALQNLPAKMVAPTIDYLKSLAHIGSDRSAPQTGTIYKSSTCGRVKLEITTLPTQFGNNVTVKLAYIQQSPLALDRLISTREILDPIQHLIHSDRGLILIVGERDSGKSTTVYASLAELNRFSSGEAPPTDRSIYAIDRQLKYTVPGINQITLSTDADNDTVATTIHTCLRQHPDVLAIGSIASLSIAQAALQAVAQGCLVFATMSAATAGSAIAQLIDLGVPAAQLYSATIGIITQKLLKQVCGECRLPDEPNRLELAQIGSPILSLHEQTYYRANSLSFSEIDRAKQMDRLCFNCQGLGYRGTIGIHEVLPIVDRLKSTIVTGDAEEIDLAARSTGMRSFLDVAIKLFQEGKTTLSELKRCVPPKTLLQNQLVNADTDADVLDLENDRTIEATLYWQHQALQAKSNYEQLLTELENYQQESTEFDRRIKQSRSQAEQSTRAEIALHLLSVVDTIELARTSIKPQTEREAAIQKGYSMLEKKMLSSIKEIGVRVTETQGRKFDSHLHEVIQEVGTHEHPAGMVISEFKRGYTLGDRVLRLAQVKVAVASSFG
jgi:type IV pilus assembly protein PilB